MPANWSLILNILLLVGVIIAIGRLMKARRESLNLGRYQPTKAKVENSPYDRQPLHDDIIAIRKVNAEDALLNEQSEQDALSENKLHAKKSPVLMPEEKINVPHQSDFKGPIIRKEPRNMYSTHTEVSGASVKENELNIKPKMAEPVQNAAAKQAPSKTPTTAMILLSAKENRSFLGYDLLQTVLASGLRFGDGHLFHRYQFSNGQGAVLCSLAAATNTGVFDLQNIGAFSVRGLCLFMPVAKDPNINAERFAAMLETAKQLAEGLNAHLLDEQHKPLNDESIARYYRVLNIEQEEEIY